MNKLFIHQVKRPKITKGAKISFNTGQDCYTKHERVGVAVKRIGKVWDVEVFDNGKKMLWQVPREDLHLIN